MFSDEKSDVKGNKNKKKVTIMDSIRRLVDIQRLSWKRWNEFIVSRLERPIYRGVKISPHCGKHGVSIVAIGYILLEMEVVAWR